MNKNVLILAALLAGSAFASDPKQFETISSRTELDAALTCAHDGYHYFARLGQTKYACIRDFQEATLAQEHMPVKEVAAFIKAKSRVPVNVLPDGKVVAR